MSDERSAKRKPTRLKRPELKKENKRRIRALRVVGAIHRKKALEVAQSIATCKHDHITGGTAACARCVEKARWSFIRMAGSLFNESNIGGKPVAITIMPREETVEAVDFPAWSIINFKRRMKDRMKVIPRDLLTFAAGSVDISLNYHIDKRKNEKGFFYAPHVHIVGITSDRKKLSKALRAIFSVKPAHDKKHGKSKLTPAQKLAFKRDCKLRKRVRRPTQVKLLTPSDYAHSYQFKNGFRARVKKAGDLLP